MAYIRGAICAQNTAEDISDKAVELVGQIIRRNSLLPKDVSAVIFTATPDLDACYPATAVRTQLGLGNSAFLCLAEMKVQNSLDHCLRVCIVAEKSQADCVHCYLGRAAALRPDLS